MLDKLRGLLGGKQRGNLPGFLVKPSDPVSKRMFGKNLVAVRHGVCRYCIEVNPEYQGIVPWVAKKSSGFELDETHVYSKKGMPSWYAVSTMKTPSVRTSPLEGFVMQPYRLSAMMNMPALMVMMPEGRKIEAYESVKLHDLGAWPEYDAPRGLEESKVYCHVFRLNGKIYKDYILCARKDDFAWKLECYFESQGGSIEISNVDFIPPGFLFGGFKPL